VTSSFNPARGLIQIEAVIVGPAGSAVVRLALDTGATSTLIDTDPLVLAGYDPPAVGTSVQTTTAGGVVQSFRLPIQSLTALGQTRTSMPVLARTLPPTIKVDGLLGLDFFRGHVLTLDFVNGEIALAPGSPAGPTP
jgi:aspartyl protease family protein